ncbi:MAG TPA: ATP-binding cassette domain-containing protein [Caulobacteraceae bacterium]|jgi:NitT/TauT family transport system ATP-binding protein|nr:ATP-binding cassette domain-containing protein [Caulobacteraceae bacterium]
MSDILAALTDAEVDYPSRGRALGPFSLSLKPGEIVALTGPSGCGKSTALRLFAGLEQPTRGVAIRHLARGETSLVFQAPTLIPWVSALDNVALPLELAKVAADERRARALAALARVGLADAKDARPDQLSGGMAMRVSLARAIVTEPKLLLLDEPFAALDSVTRRNLIEDVHRLWSQSKSAILFVTHDVEEAAYLAERVVVMTPGPGRTAAEIATQGQVPRPEGFRATADFRHTAETIAQVLGDAMGRAA